VALADAPGAQARPLACDGSRPLEGRPGLDGWNWVRSGKKPPLSELLRKFGLDESRIEAQAFRSRADEFESLDRMLALAEGRRDKALRCVADPSARPGPCDARPPHLVGLSRYETHASAPRDRASLAIV
jgi:hypothetical protein